MPGSALDPIPHARRHRLRGFLARVAAGMIYALSLSAVVFVALDWFSSYQGHSGVLLRAPGGVILQYAESPGRMWIVLCRERGARESRLHAYGLVTNSVVTPTAGILYTHFSHGLIGRIESGSLRPSFDALGVIVGYEQSLQPDRAIIFWYTALPHWVVMLVSCCSLYCGRRWWMLTRHRPGKAARFCVTCGYDLRASADRCPECGTAVPEGHKPELNPAPSAPLE